MALGGKQFLSKRKKYPTAENPPSRKSCKNDNPPEALRPRGNYLYDKGENDELIDE